MEMELANHEFSRVENIFSRCLLPVLNVELWSLYLNYIRRRQNLNTDVGGKARQIVSSAYDFVLENIGLDRESGSIWQDYIQFVKTSPGNIGGSGWQDQQKMDQLRKLYQRAICIPVKGVEQIWKEYDQFENGLNKITVLLSLVLCGQECFVNGFLGPQISSRKISSIYDRSLILIRVK